ncbi:MAG: HU family DNA-binding protein [Candidatus Dadabacteria bacterium]|nr:HU family DNA-binding protein [Candidatus Dadabacteria bacterium]
MSKPMTKSQILNNLAEKTGMSKKDVGKVLEEFTALAYDEAKNSFTIPGIGKLVLVFRNARDGRNPSTGERIRIPAKKVIKFRVSKACKDAVLGNE